MGKLLDFVNWLQGDQQRQSQQPSPLIKIKLFNKRLARQVKKMEIEKHKASERRKAKKERAEQRRLEKKEREAERREQAQADEFAVMPDSELRETVANLLAESPKSG